MGKKYLIIDGNSIGYAAHHATKLSVGEIETQAIFGFLNSMRDLRLEYPDYQPIVLWDGRATWRFELHPKYKSNRDNDPKKAAIKEAYVKQRPYIFRALKYLGVRQMTVRTHEADDMAGYLVEKLSANPDNEIVMISGDQDWIQLLRKNVTWRDIRNESRVVTLSNLMDKTGYATPYAFLEGKCLQGDTSDCISGVGGIGETGAPEFLAQFGSVRNFWRKCDSGEFKPTKKAHISLWKGYSKYTKEEWAETFTGDKSDEKALKKHMDEWEGQGRSIFMRNFRMMQLLRVTPPEKEEVQVVNGNFDIEAFKELCEELAFNSILINIGTFCRHFKKEKNYE